ncbi:MAG: hypothetical protein ABIO84_04240 [Lysobacter sp.]
MSIKTGIASLSLIALMGFAGAVSADTLLIDRVDRVEATIAPARGMSMSQIEAAYGAPAQRLDPRGGQKRQWPTINRWVYPAFTIYFEKNRVIDVVANQAFTSEIGPKPAVL